MDRPTFLNLKMGHISRIIDKQYPLSQAPEALRYLGEGRAKGKIIITTEK